MMGTGAGCHNYVERLSRWPSKLAPHIACFQRLRFTLRTASASLNNQVGTGAPWSEALRLLYDRAKEPRFLDHPALKVSDILTLIQRSISPFHEDN
jgi:hypothetical protein